jgi:hypothetical protein
MRHLHPRDTTWTASSEQIATAALASSFAPLLSTAGNSTLSDIVGAGTSDVLFRALGYSRWFQLNRTAKGNALTLPMVNAMAHALQVYQQEDSSCANIVLLAGHSAQELETPIAQPASSKQRHFCTGGDILGTSLHIF